MTIIKIFNLICNDGDRVRVFVNKEAFICSFKRYSLKKNGIILLKNKEYRYKEHQNKSQNSVFYKTSNVKIIELDLYDEITTLEELERNLIDD